MRWTGYFVINHMSLASSQTLLGQVWKEYALSDSRYLTADPFTLCVEAITVVRLPASNCECFRPADSKRTLAPVGPPELCCSCLYCQS
jgi:hypothetical protein